MPSNDTYVVPASSHADEARHFADQAETASDNLVKLYGQGRTDSEQIAQVHQALRSAQKLAEVHALLAIADELQRIRVMVADDIGAPAQHGPRFTGLVGLPTHGGDE